MADRPNVIYLHSHDTGRHVQPYGHAVPTPAIQRLAEQGVLFRRAFATTATCSGSRAALVTGRYPHVNGMTGLAHRGWELNDIPPAPHPHAAPRRATSPSSSASSTCPTRPTPSATTASTRSTPTTSRPSRRWPSARSRAGCRSRSSSPSASSRRTAASSSPRRPSTSSTRCRRSTCPTSPRSAATWRTSSPARDRWTAACSRSSAALERTGLDERTLVILTTDHGLPFPGAKATLFDRGLGVSLILRGPGRLPRRPGAGRDGLPPRHLPHALRPRRAPAPGGPAGLLAPAARHRRRRPPARRAVRGDHLSRRLRAAARGADRPLQAHPPVRASHGPVLPNIDDGPSKDALVALGWDGWATEEERLHDLLLDPNEMHNLVDDPAYAAVARDLRRRLLSWMDDTDDPLLRGPVALPPRGRANARSQRSATSP